MFFKKVFGPSSSDSNPQLPLSDSEVNKNGGETIPTNSQAVATPKSSSTHGHKRSSLLMSFTSMTLKSPNDASQPTSPANGQDQTDVDRWNPFGSRTKGKWQDEEALLDQLFGGLDLTRLTEKFMLMGLPWKHRTEKRSHRNNINDLAQLLNSRFKRRFMLFDLSGNFRNSIAQLLFAF